jgi:hypothetical protein
MRVTFRQTPALLVGAALAVACASRPPVPPFKSLPTPPEPGSAGDLRPVAKHAGAVFSFRPTPDGDEAPPEIQRMHAEMQQLFGVDVTSPAALAYLGADPSRPVVVSWAIVDPADLHAVITSPKSPTRDVPFVIRSEIVVPIADVAHTEDMLAKASLDPTCARRSGEPDRWAALVARLQDPAERVAVERSSYVYFCRRDVNASVAQVDADRRTITWVVAAGWGALLAQAAASIELDGDLMVRLHHDGFFAARAGIYTTPAAEARLYTATGLVKVEAAVGGVEETMRGRIWRQGLWEATATSRLVDSEPRLFEDVRIADRVSSWRLTDAGKTFFASLNLARPSDAEQLKKAIVGALKPRGLFADRSALVQTIHEAGGGAFLLAHHFLWPHVLAFAASQPEAMPSLAADWSGAGTTVEFDARAGILRLHAETAK